MQRTGKYNQANLIFFLVLLLLAGLITGCRPDAEGGEEGAIAGEDEVIEVLPTATATPVEQRIVPTVDSPQLGRNIPTPTPLPPTATPEPREVKLPVASINNWLEWYGDASVREYIGTNTGLMSHNTVSGAYMVITRYERRLPDNLWFDNYSALQVENYVDAIISGLDFKGVFLNCPEDVCRIYHAQYSPDVAGASYVVKIYVPLQSGSESIYADWDRVAGDFNRVLLSTSFKVVE